LGGPPEVQFLGDGDEARQPGQGEHGNPDALSE